MKNTTILLFVLFLFAIFINSCKEDDTKDWKILNDRFYSTLEDSLKNNKLFKKTESGIYYYIVKEGDLRHPNKVDIINVTCQGTLIDKSTFSTLNSSNILVSSQIKGMQEILHLMKENSEYICYIPYSLGYDTEKSNSLIPAYSVLKYDLKINSTGQ